MTIAPSTSVQLVPDFDQDVGVGHRDQWPHPETPATENRGSALAPESRAAGRAGSDLGPTGLAEGEPHAAVVRRRIGIRITRIEDAQLTRPRGRKGSDGTGSRVSPGGSYCCR